MGSRLTFRKKTTEAWQYRIRKNREKYYCNKKNIWGAINKSLTESVVRDCNREQARKIILEYEWLGGLIVWLLLKLCRYP